MTAATAGATHTVAITAEPTPATITFADDYAGAPEGYRLLKYALDTKPSVVYTYGGEPMHYAFMDGAHYVIYLVSDSVTAETAAEIVATADPAVEFDGDINGDSELEIVDAQIAFDIATGVHDNTTLDKLSISQRLNADFNADGKVTKDDAYAIQAKLHEAA
jgi:hypothetical protein